MSWNTSPTGLLGIACSPASNRRIRHQRLGRALPPPVAAFVLRPHGVCSTGLPSLPTGAQSRGRLQEIQRQHADHGDSRARFLLKPRLAYGLEAPSASSLAYGLGPCQRWLALYYADFGSPLDTRVRPLPACLAGEPVRGLTGADPPPSPVFVLGAASSNACICRPATGVFERSPESGFICVACRYDGLRSVAKHIGNGVVLCAVTAMTTGTRGFSRQAPDTPAIWGNSPDSDRLIWRQGRPRQ